ncbi:hypothetical protein FAVG1_06715 [Fusarium avenaceum]|nr:hypothetical protein FAVG1_06715 [Fusarium avenaceum]
MKFTITALLLLLGAANAIPSEVTTKESTQSTCNVQCSIWYTKCYRRPWAYLCDDSGKFVRRGWNPDCEKNCWCNCDAK